MGVKLDWTNRCIGDEVRVYRDIATFDDLSLPTPLTTLGADVATYTDETVEAGTEYFYAVAAISGADLELSSVVSITPLSNGGDVPEAFTLTIASGKVSSDLTDFPLYVDLSDMPAGFWAAVDEGGGNVRAYASDGATELALDVVFCAKTAETGAAFVRVPTIAAASTTTVIIKTLTEGTAKAAPGSTYGRNAVWADYEIVYHLGADPNDRTGNHAALRVNGDPDYLKEVATSGDINAHEGIATDGTYYYAFDSFAIRKYDMSWNLVSETTNIATSYSNGLGGGCVSGGVIYVAADNGGTQYLAKYNASDLSFIEHFDIESFASGAADFCMVGGMLHTIQWVPTTGATTIIKIDPDTGASAGTITLSTALIEAQGITFWRGAFWVTADNVDETFRVETDGTVVSSGLFGPRTRPTTWEGIDVAPDGDGLIVVDDTGTSEVVRTFKDFGLDLSAGGGMEAFAVSRNIGDFTAGALGTAWTVGISVQAASTAQKYFLGVVPTGGYSSTQSVHIGADYISVSDSRVAVYDGSNGWLYSASNAQISTAAMQRVNVAYNGTTARHLWVNGGDKGTDSTITARGAGIAHLNIGASTENNYTDAFIGLMGFAYARAGVLPDAWIAAEYANLNAPGTFYSIT